MYIIYITVITALTEQRLVNTANSRHYLSWTYAVWMSKARLIGFLTPALRRVVGYRPLAFDTSRDFFSASHQYKFFPIQSTARALGTELLWTI